MGSKYEAVHYYAPSEAGHAGYAQQPPAVHGHVQQVPRTPWWRHWQPVQLVGCFVLGIVGAIAHHFYYAALDGKRVEEQAWIVRSGTAIALAIKLLFSTSVGTAYSQRVWRSLRKRPFSLDGVDALFSLPNNAFKFFRLEVLFGAVVASLIALMSWSFLLVPIIIPASISVRSASEVTTNAVFPIYNLDFTQDVIDVHYNNGTPVFSQQLAEYVTIGASWRAYVGPSSLATGFVYNTLYGKRILDVQSPCGANCSFSQVFNGPAYKCDDVDFQNNNDTGNPFCNRASNSGFGVCGSVFDPITVSAFDKVWYDARNSTADACRPETGCVPATDGYQDGKLWIAYQYLLPEYRQFQNDQGTNSTAIPDSAFERHMFVCHSYNATYSLRRTYTNFQHAVASNLTYLNPVNFTAAKLSKVDVASYAAFSIHQTLYSLLSGSIQPNGRVVETDLTHIAGSALVEEAPFPLKPHSVYATTGIQKPVRYLRQAIQDLHFNITVGLLGLTPSLLYSANATSADALNSSLSSSATATAAGASSAAQPAEVSTALNVWSYDRRVLLLTYAAAALLDLVAIFWGLAAARRNGGWSGFEFARVLATTRGGPGAAVGMAGESALDAVVRGWDDGMDPMPEDVRRCRVMFGGVGQAVHAEAGGAVAGYQGQAGYSHVANGQTPRQRLGFSVEGQVTPIH